MLENLIKALKNKRYEYTLINLHRVDIEFTNYIACIIIQDDKYKIYIFNNKGDLLDEEQYIYPENVVNYIIKSWELFN